MIVLWLLVLGAALYLMGKRRQQGPGARGSVWFIAWGMTGAVFTFSLLTGFSIGVFLFPVAAFATFWLAVHAPHWREAVGFPLGAALLVLAVILFV
jgi:hypothetical protein